jgi:pSer/pThr/pTyr-binding forkhead associated (FHA) protein
MKVVLEVHTDKSKSEVEIELNSSIVLGRSDKADHVVNDDKVSGRHCRFTFSLGNLQLDDLRSKNGTFLNGLRVEQSEIFIGDEIKIGGSKIIFALNKMDENTIKTLTYQGQSKDRMSNVLKLDLDGSFQARQVQSIKINTFEQKATPNLVRGNEGLSIASRNIDDNSAQTEHKSTKKTTALGKLSKNEIKQRHKAQSSMASTIDIILTILAAVLPLLVGNHLVVNNPELLQEKRLTLIVGLELLTLGLFFFFNFKFMKFTLGERLAGIEKLYQQQD